MASDAMVEAHARDMVQAQATLRQILSQGLPRQGRSRSRDGPDARRPVRVEKWALAVGPRPDCLQDLVQDMLAVVEERGEEFGLGILLGYKHLHLRKVDNDEAEQSDVTTVCSLARSSMPEMVPSYHLSLGPASAMIHYPACSAVTRFVKQDLEERNMDQWLVWGARAKVPIPVLFLFLRQTGYGAGRALGEGFLYGEVAG